MVKALDCSSYSIAVTRMGVYYVGTSAHKHMRANIVNTGFGEVWQTDVGVQTYWHKQHLALVRVCRHCLDLRRLPTALGNLHLPDNLHSTAHLAGLPLTQVAKCAAPCRRAHVHSEAVLFTGEQQPGLLLRHARAAVHLCLPRQQMLRHMRNEDETSGNHKGTADECWPHAR
jgi:hypothetical protein